MRSEAELRDAMSDAKRSGDFDDLIRILDHDLRLITPTDPEGLTGEGRPSRPGGDKYYQLTHDYLVHSLRDWLNRKQRESRRGRAELRLVERAAFWNAKPEVRHLPSVWEWLNIRLLTDRSHWSVPQRRMMNQAQRVHGLRALVPGHVGACCPTIWGSSTCSATSRNGAMSLTWIISSRGRAGWWTIMMIHTRSTFSRNVCSAA